MRRCGHFFSRILILCVLLPVACTQGRQPGDNVVSVNLLDIDEPSWTEFFKKIEVIPLENRDSAYLNISCCFTYLKVEDKFYIMDMANKSIIIFNADGKWLETFNRYGRGPEEYVMLADMAYNEEMRSMDILEATGTIISYDLEPPHRMIRRIKIPTVRATHYLFPDGSGYYLLSQYEDHALNYLDAETGELTAVTGAPEVERAVRAGYHASRSPFYRLSGQVYYVDGASGAVFRLEGNRAVPCRSWDFGRYTFDLEKVPVGKSDRPYERLDAFSSSMAGPFVNTVETDRYVFAEVTFMKREQDIVLDKESGKVSVFLNWKEGLYFFPGYFFDDAIYFVHPPEHTDQLLPDGLSNLDEDSNFMIIKYVL